jgi:pyruvate,water dikinase
VVAREYGIPAVVSAKGARSFIKTGDMVALDGESGTVELVHD